MKVPDKYVGLIIGKSSETLKGIATRSDTKIFVPQRNINPDSDEREIEIMGAPHSIELAKQEILSLITRVSIKIYSNLFFRLLIREEIPMISLKTLTVVVLQFITKQSWHLMVIPSMVQYQML